MHNTKQNTTKRRKKPKAKELTANPVALILTACGTFLTGLAAFIQALK